MRVVHVAATDEQAHAEARHYLASGDMRRVGGGPIAQTRIGWGSHSRGMGRDSERPHDELRGETTARAAEDYDFAVEQGLAIVGSPETVIRRLREAHRRMGFDLFCTNHQIGRMPPDLVNQSIELFGREVIPALQAVHAQNR
jgi:alkanesulfonate monooxygenase SsuD/methylene tetrahydromethanopterin reductase-like flavin-dependent oxidoreductase (luciferase family)